jgi:hypothetical protein
MTAQITESPGGALESQIAKLESRFARNLPSDYRSFLRHYNGGKPIPNRFDYTLPDGRTWSDGISFFLGIDHQDRYQNIFHYLRIYDERLPQEFIPIGADSGGDLIVLSLSEKNLGSIYFWDHNEEAEEDEPPTYDNLYFVAKSFTDFLNCLRPFNPEELAEIEKHAAQAEVK